MSLNDKMTALADAIRAKTGGTSTMTIDQMAEAVSGIAVGSGGVDTSDATATASQILKDKTAYVSVGKVTGTLKYYPEDGTTGISAVANSVVAVPIDSTNKTHVRLDYDIVNPAAFLEGSGISLKATLESFGDATASDVVSGKTFTSTAGLKAAGTVEEHTLAGTNVLPSGTELSSNETSVLIQYRFAQDTLCRKGSGYLFQRKFSDFGDATAEDVAAGRRFTSAAGLLVTGTATAGSSGGSSANNCEAYHITSTTDKISFHGTGTVTVWGYGFYSSGTYSKTTYAFVGDGYYTASSYNTPTKTDATFSINEDGTLSGLPSNITDIDLLVTIGI